MLYQVLENRIEDMTETTNPSPEGVDKLNTLVVLEKVRTLLTDPARHGWMAGALWGDQDAPYPGCGPLCLAGAVAVACGYGYLPNGREMDARIDYEPVMVELDAVRRVLFPDPNDGVEWFENLSPGDRVAAFNDAKGRTLTEVLTLIEATSAKVGA